MRRKPDWVRQVRRVMIDDGYYAHLLNRSKARAARAIEQQADLGERFHCQWHDAYRRAAALPPRRVAWTPCFFCEGELGESERSAHTLSACDRTREHAYRNWSAGSTLIAASERS